MKTNEAFIFEDDEQLIVFQKLKHISLSLCSLTDVPLAKQVPLLTKDSVHKHLDIKKHEYMWQKSGQPGFLLVFDILELSIVTIAV